MTERKLYWAYGSNTNVAQMAERCPTATVFAPLVLPNAVLRFRGVADVAYLKGASCPGALWEIAPSDEAALDRYEAVDPNHPERGLYLKRYFTAEVDGSRRRILYYQMQTVGIMPPSQFYLDVIAQGYRDFGLPLERLERALAHSWAKKRKTPYLVGRWKRRGAGRLARSIDRPAAEPTRSVPDEEPTKIGSPPTRCQAPHCWERIEPDEEICPHCGAWQVQGRSRRAATATDADRPLSSNLVKGPNR